MMRRKWFGALLGCLGGVLPMASGQADRPPVVRAVSALSPTVSIGRPIAARAVQRSVPGPLPAFLRPTPTPPPTPPSVVFIDTVPPPGAVIATSGKAIPAGEEPDEALHGDLFASDRRPAPPLERVAHSRADTAGPILPASGPPAGDIPGLVNWSGLYPVTPPPPAGPVGEMPPLETPTARFYGGAEYLLWWTRPDRAPVLATTGSAFLPGAANAPPAGSLDTRILQDGRLDHGTRTGGRFTAGWYFDECGGKAVEVSGFFLGQASSRFSADQNQFPVLTRPFFNANPAAGAPREDVQFVAFPGAQNGRLTIDAPSELWGVDANVICCACRGCDWRVSWLAGLRYLNLHESLTVQEDITFLAASPLAGRRVLVTDSFATRNQFYGAQAGVEGRWLRGRWTLDGRFKLAMGVTEQNLTVNGSQVFLVGANPDPRPGGLLALPSNIGSFSRTSFAVVPEVGGSVGYYVTDRVRLSVGYNFLYWSSVVRPGEQIDRNLNSQQIPGFNFPNVTPSTTPPPVRLFNTSGYYAHGLTFGVEFNF